MLFLDTGGRKGLYFLGEHGRSNSDEGANIRGTESKKGQAFRIFGSNEVFSVIQLAFSGIKYPGVTILPYIHFHLYSAPIWVATFVNFASIATVVWFLDEKLVKPEKKKGIPQSWP